MGEKRKGEEMVGKRMEWEDGDGSSGVGVGAGGRGRGRGKEWSRKRYKIERGRRAMKQTEK